MNVRWGSWGGLHGAAAPLWPTTDRAPPAQSQLPVPSHPSRHRGVRGEGKCGVAGTRGMAVGVPVAGSTGRRGGASAAWAGLLWRLSQASVLHRARHTVWEGSGARVPLSPIRALLYKRSTCKRILICPATQIPAQGRGLSFC